MNEVKFELYLNFQYKCLYLFCKSKQLKYVNNLFKENSPQYG